jgi:acetyl esterase/lipase
MAQLVYDPEYAVAIQDLMSKISMPSTPLEVGDIISRRENINKLMGDILAQLPPVSDVEDKLVANVKSYDGTEVPLYAFTKIGTAVTGADSAVVYTHGGGYFCLSVAIYKPLLQIYVSMTGVTLYAMDYRLPPEHPYPAPVEDCFAGLKHISDNAADLGIDPTRIILMGDSAGGGLCAGTAILARDRGVQLAKQMVIHGNLDDRNVVPGSLPDFKGLATWGIDDNITGWEAYLGPGHESRPKLPASASPSRLTDFSGLAPLYLDVPALDILRDEGIKYAAKAAEAGVQTELHVYPSVPHGFELFAPETRMAMMVMENRVRAILSV